MSNALEVMNWYKRMRALSPDQLYAWAGKKLLFLALIATLCVTSYCQGRDAADTKWEKQVAEQKAAISDLKAKNAAEASDRLTNYVRRDQAIQLAASAAQQAVKDYYANNPVQERVVERTKLVPVPGKEELVYVPIGTCPNDFLNADELRLWNLGVEGYNADPANPK